MRRPGFWIIGGLIVLVGGLGWWLSREAKAPGFVVAKPETPAGVAVPSSLPRTQKPANPPASAELKKPARLIVPPGIAALAHRLHAPDHTAREDLEILQELLVLFRRSNNGRNPGGGLNEEIVDQMRGKNPKHLAVLPPDLPAIDAQDRLLDRWGTPYFFHPLSHDVLELRSAGPDRKLWTPDDVQLPGD